MIADDHQHMYGTGKNGPTIGGRHMMHHPPSNSNSNYNVSSYGYDNYAIDDDMMMLDEDDLEDVDRLYDMNAVWADHEHEKHKIPPNSASKKVCNKKKYLAGFKREGYKFSFVLKFT